MRTICDDVSYRGDQEMMTMTNLHRDTPSPSSIMTSSSPTGNGSRSRRRHGRSRGAETVCWRIIATPGRRRASAVLMMTYAPHRRRIPARPTTLYDTTQQRVTLICSSYRRNWEKRTKWSCDGRKDEDGKNGTMRRLWCVMRNWEDYDTQNV